MTNQKYITHKYVKHYKHLEYFDQNGLKLSIKQSLPLIAQLEKKGNIQNLNSKIKQSQNKSLRAICIIPIYPRIGHPIGI